MRATFPKESDHYNRNRQRADLRRNLEGDKRSGDEACCCLCGKYLKPGRARHSLWHDGRGGMLLHGETAEPCDRYGGPVGPECEKIVVKDYLWPWPPEWWPK